MANSKADCSNSSSSMAAIDSKLSSPWLRRPKPPPNFFSLVKTCLHLWHQFSSNGDAVGRPSRPVRRFAPRPRYSACSASFAFLLEPLRGWSNLEMFVLLYETRVSHCRISSFVFREAARLDAVKALSSLEAVESVMFRGVTNLRGWYSGMSTESPASRLESFGAESTFIGPACVGTGCSGRRQPFEAGFDDVEGC